MTQKLNSYYFLLIALGPYFSSDGLIYVSIAMTNFYACVLFRADGKWKINVPLRLTHDEDSNFMTKLSIYSELEKYDAKRDALKIKECANHKMSCIRNGIGATENGLERPCIHTHIITDTHLHQKNITHTHSTAHNIIWVKVKDNAAGVLSLKRIAALVCGIAFGLLSNCVVDNKSKIIELGLLLNWVLSFFRAVSITVIWSRENR